VRLEVAPAPLRRVANEPCGALPAFNAATCGWGKGYKLAGVTTQETTAKGALVPGSVELRAAPDGAPLRRGRDYEVDEDWGTVGWLPGGPVPAGQPAWASYAHGLARLDSVVEDTLEFVLLRQRLPYLTLMLNALNHPDARGLRLYADSLLALFG
jgi:hypothetical protein